MRTGTFTGNLARDWEKKTVGSYCVYENTLAVKCGKDNKETMWVNLSQWNEKGGVILTQYTGKGSRLLVVGDIDVSAYKDKNGDAKPDIRVRINSFEFIGDKKQEESGHNTAKSNGYQPQPTEDEIPF